MTQHTELIDRLRRRAWLARSGTTTDIHLIEDEAINALEAQAREIDGLRKDAERYQFLRDTCWLDTPLEHVICLQLNAKWDRAIDEAIDAAKETKP